VADDPAVPYQALYRRFRPQRFEEVLGQAHVTRPLRAAVRDGKVAHAYLFSGPRGTGKTSTARILAMALNCELPEDGEPDGTCDSCVAIRLGSSMDVQELDAASNRRIDDVRDLLSRVALGTPGRSKIYIVDEVHQLTSDASTALLKTLEDPPRHVTFVLATTDPQKVLPTIRSRTQHFEFRLLGSDVLGSLLRDVVGKAELDLPPEAIDLVVRRGHGSARDALSALDQVAAAGTAEDEAAVVPDLVDAIADQDAARLLLSVAEAAEAGLDPRRLANDLLEYLRNGFLATRARSLVMLADDAAAQAEAQARRLGPAALVRAMTTVGQALIDMRDAADPRTTLEVALVRLADPDIDDSRAALLVRIERLEQALGQRGGPVPPPARPVPGSPPPTHPEPRPRSDPPSTGRPPTPSGNPAGGSALGAHRAPVWPAPPVWPASRVLPAPPVLPAGRVLPAPPVLPARLDLPAPPVLTAGRVLPASQVREHHRGEPDRPPLRQRQARGLQPTSRVHLRRRPGPVRGRRPPYFPAARSSPWLGETASWPPCARGSRCSWRSVVLCRSENRPCTRYRTRASWPGRCPSGARSRRPSPTTSGARSPSSWCSTRGRDSTLREAPPLRPAEVREWVSEPARPVRAGRRQPGRRAPTIPPTTISPSSKTRRRG
jgi:DNA polymerase-3 subunit gamma/tau